MAFQRHSIGLIGHRESMTSSSNFVDSTQDELGRGTAHVARSARSAVLIFLPFLSLFTSFYFVFDLENLRALWCVPILRMLGWATVWHLQSKRAKLLVGCRGYGELWMIQFRQGKLESRINSLAMSLCFFCIENSFDLVSCLFLRLMV